ncbi:MAG: glycosyltransferase family 4 protein [Acidobacteriota bacterium]|nr:glycosyltransferase family 4 protein [Acidobacteriota bacterium]
MSSGPAATRLPKGVCILATDIDGGAGGVQVQSRRLAAGFDRCGIRTIIMSRNYAGLPRREHRDSVLILRSPVISRSAAAANALLYLLCVVFWLIRFRKEYDVIQAQQMFGSAMAGLLVSRLLRKPVTVRVTSTGELGEVAYLRAMRGSALRLRQLRNVRGWIALTQLMKEEIVSLGIPAERVSIIPNSAELPERTRLDPGVRAQYRRALGLADDIHVAVFTGRLSSEKGLDTLLDAWRRVLDGDPTAKLILLGPGGAFRNVEAELRAQATSLALGDSVEFRGHVDNTLDFLYASDTFVLPTRTEGMSNSLVEAMAAGAAIITTAIPAHRGVIEHDVHALLIRPDDEEALANAIVSIFHDPALRARLGRAARDRAERVHAFPRMLERYLDVYARVLDESQRR